MEVNLKSYLKKGHNVVILSSLSLIMKTTTLKKSSFSSMSNPFIKLIMAIKTISCV